MRVFHVQGDQFTELPALPEAAPDAGYLWIGIARVEFEAQNATVQAALQRWTGSQLVDLHVSDLLNNQLPSHFDYTSWYDLLVFRRLAASNDAPDTVMPQIDTSPVGFAVFDRVLLTVHPADCQVREFFATRLQQQQGAGSETRTGTRVPPSPADLALRMVNFMVDSYLDLRRLLTRQIDQLQRDLFDANGGYGSWKSLLDSRNNLHLLEDTCEDQRAAITEWIDAQDELPPSTDHATLRERELLRVRKDGYALDDEEFLPGLVCIAVQVPGESNLCIAVQAPAMRLPLAKTKQLLPALRTAAEALGRIDAQTTSG